MVPKVIATIMPLTRLIRSSIAPKMKAQTILTKFVTTITRTTSWIESPADKPIIAPLCIAHSEMKMPLTETSALARNVVPNESAILGFLNDCIPTVTSSFIEGF